MTKTLEQLAAEYRAAEKALKRALVAARKATDKLDRVLAEKKSKDTVTASENLRMAARTGKGLSEAALAYRDTKRTYAKLCAGKPWLQREKADESVAEAGNRAIDLFEAMQRLAMRS